VSESLHNTAVSACIDVAFRKFSVAAARVQTSRRHAESGRRTRGSRLTLTNAPEKNTPRKKGRKWDNDRPKRNNEHTQKITTHKAEKPNHTVQAL